jgi:hypothetical protein
VARTFRRGLFSRLELAVGEPIAPAAVSPSLQEQVRAARRLEISGRGERAGRGSSAAPRLVESRFPFCANSIMSGNTFGTLFTVTTFGESHGPAIGCVIDGCPRA